MFRKNVAKNGAYDNIKGIKKEAFALSLENNIWKNRRGGEVG